MTNSPPARRTGRRTGRRTAMAATLALAVSGFAFAATTGAAQAKPCPPDLCDPIVVVKPKFPWPPGPVCLSCPDRITLLERYQEIVLPEVDIVGLPEVLNPRGFETGFDGGGGINLPGGGGPGR